MAPKPLPAPVEEDLSFYSAIDRNGCYTTWRQIANTVSREPSAATSNNDEEVSSAVVLSFSVRASEDVRVCFGPDAATDALLGLEIVLGKNNNAESTLSVCGTVVSSCAHPAAGILDPTDFVPFQVTLFLDHGRIEVACLWPLDKSIEVTAAGEAAGEVSPSAAAVASAVEPFLTWEIDPEIMEHLTKYSLTGGTAGRVFFRSIQCVQSKALLSTAQSKPQERAKAAARELSVDKMELAQEWPTTDLLLERPSFACLNGVFPAQHQQYRRGGSGGGLMGSAHVWAPASGREEYVHAVAVNMDEAAVLQQMEIVSHVLESLYARAVLSRHLEISPSETLSALEQCMHHTSCTTSPSSPSLSSNTPSDKNELSNMPQPLEQLFVLLGARNGSAKVLKGAIAEALASNPILSANLVKLAVRALHEATGSEAPEVLFRISECSDEAVEALPALPFAKLLSDVVLESSNFIKKNRAIKVGNSEDVDMSAVELPLITAWVESLKSGSASLKQMACRYLTHFLRRAERHDHHRVGGDNDGGKDDNSSSATPSKEGTANGGLLVQCLKLLPISRLEPITSLRLSREREVYPAVSPYLKALIELLAQVRGAANRLGAVDVHGADAATTASAIQSSPLEVPHATATALRFEGGASGLHLNGRSDLRHDGTMEFWLKRTGPSKGNRLASSPSSGGIAALLLRCSVASGRPGCVGYLIAGSSGGSSAYKEVAFEYEVPANQLVHLAFVHQTKPIPVLKLYANGVQVGEHVLSRGPLSLPVATIGDLRHSFQGLLYGVRHWRCALTSHDLATAATKGPNAKLTQCYEDCVCDLDLLGGDGCLVHDRSGDAPVILGGRTTTWVPAHDSPWPSSHSPKSEGSASLLPSSEDGVPTESHEKEQEGDGIEEAKVVGVFTREGVGNGRFRKAEREPVTLIYRTDQGEAVSEGAFTTEAKEAEKASTRISGTLHLHDSALTAEVTGTLEVESGSLSFTIQRFTQRGRLAKVDASSGKIEKEWLLGACFKGKIEARKLSGAWQVPLLQAMAGGTVGDKQQQQLQELPTARVELSSQRKSACLSLSSGNTSVRMEGREKWGSVLLLHRDHEENVATSSANQAPTSGALSTQLSSSSQPFALLDLFNKSPDRAIVRTRNGLPRIASAAAPSPPLRVYFEVTITTSHAWCVGWMAQPLTASSSTALKETTPPCTIGLESKGSSSEVQMWKNGASVPFEALPTAAETSDSASNAALSPLEGSSAHIPPNQQEQPSSTSAAKTVPWRVGSVIGCMLELESGVVRFALDGVYMGVADAGHWCDEVADASEATRADPVVYHPAVSLPVDSGCLLNFGASSLVFAPPNGYMSWVEASDLVHAPSATALTPTTTSSAASTGETSRAAVRGGGEKTDNSSSGSSSSSNSSSSSLLVVTGSDVGAEWLPLSEYPSLWSDTLEKPPLPTLPTCHRSGQWHWEFSVTCVGDEGMFGGSSCAIGVCRLESALGQGPEGGGGSNGGRSSRGVIPGQDAHSWAYLSSGDKIHGERSRSFGPTWRNNDVIGLELDLNLGTVRLQIDFRLFRLITHAPTSTSHFDILAFLITLSL